MLFDRLRWVPNYQPAEAAGVSTLTPLAHAIAAIAGYSAVECEAFNLALSPRAFYRLDEDAAEGTTSAHQTQVGLLNPIIYHYFNGASDAAMWADQGSETTGVGTPTNASIVATPLTTESTHSYSVAADGYLTQNNWASVLDGRAVISFVCWVRPTNIDGTTQGILYVAGNANTTGLLVRMETATSPDLYVGGRSINTDGFDSMRSTFQLQENETQMIYAAWDFINNTVYFSLNAGTIESEGSMGWSQSTFNGGTNGALMTGRTDLPANEELEGLIDQPAFFDRLLTQEEIQNIYLHGIGEADEAYDYETYAESLNPLYYHKFNGADTTAMWENSGTGTPASASESGTVNISDKPLVNQSKQSFFSEDDAGYLVPGWNAGLDGASVIAFVGWIELSEHKTQESNAAYKIITIELGDEEDGPAFVMDIPNDNFGVGGQRLRLRGKSTTTDSVQTLQTGTAAIIDNRIAMVYGAIDYANDIMYYSLNGGTIVDSGGSATFGNSTVTIGDEISLLNAYNSPLARLAIKGRMDQPMVFTRLLTQTEISQLYQRGSQDKLNKTTVSMADVIIGSAPLAFWKCDSAYTGSPNDVNYGTDSDVLDPQLGDNQENAHQKPLDQSTDRFKCYRITSGTHKLDVGGTSTNGVGQYIQGASQFTFSCLMKISSIPNSVPPRILSVQGRATHETLVGLSVDNVTQELALFVRSIYTDSGLDWTNTGLILDIGRTYLIACSVDLTDNANVMRRISVNGQPWVENNVGALSQTTFDITNATGHFVGNYTNGTSYALYGYFDSICWWDRVLNESELENIYRASIGLAGCDWDSTIDDLAPLTWYKMDGLLVSNQPFADSGSGGNSIGGLTTGFTDSQTALIANGSGDAVDVLSNNASIGALCSDLNGASQIAFFGWINPSNVSGSHRLWALETNVENGYGAGLTINAGVIDGFMKSTSADSSSPAASSTTLQTGQTYFIYFDHDFTTGITRISVNASEFDTTSRSNGSSTALLGNEGAMFINPAGFSGAGTAQYEGLVDEWVWLRNNNLNIEQVRTLYNIGECPDTATVTADDATANALDGAYQGSPMRALNPIVDLGTSAYFNGSSDYLDLDALQSDLNGNAIISVVFWFNMENTLADQTLFYIDSDVAGTPALRVWYDASAFVFKAQGRSVGADTVVQEDDSNNIDPYTNYMIYAAIDAPNDTVYLSFNGGSPGSTAGTMANATITCATPVRAASGPDTATERFQGRMDNVLVFDKLLTAQQLSDMYENCRQRDTTGF